MTSPVGAIRAIPRARSFCGLDQSDPSSAHVMMFEREQEHLRAHRVRHGDLARVARDRRAGEQRRDRGEHRRVRALEMPAHEARSAVGRIHVYERATVPRDLDDPLQEGVAATQAATTAATTTAAGQSTRDARDGRAATRARVVGERRVAEEAVPASAAANSAALANRSAGNFSSAVRIASATSSGTLLRSAVTGSGALCITRAITACAFGPVNGGSPQARSQSRRRARDRRAGGCSPA